MEADFGFRLEGRAHRCHAGADVVGQQVARRVGQVDAVGAVAFHQQALLDQAFGAVHVGHHQEANGVHAQAAGVGDVLFADIGLGAMSGDANGVDPQFMGHFQVIDGADARQQQGRNLGLFHQRDHCRQILLVGVGREAIVHRATAEAVAVGDFDQRHAGRVEAAGNVFHLLQADLVTLGVHAVAQAHVVNGDAFAAKIHGRLLMRGRFGR
ncbi:hypothetical protein D3C80_251660 [compost metagenome]